MLFDHISGTAADKTVTSIAPGAVNLVGRPLWENGDGRPSSVYHTDRLYLCIKQHSHCVHRQRSNVCERGGRSQQSSIARFQYAVDRRSMPSMLDFETVPAFTHVQSCSTPVEGVIQPSTAAVRTLLTVNVARVCQWQRRLVSLNPAIIIFVKFAVSPDLDYITPCTTAISIIQSKLDYCSSLSTARKSQIPACSTVRTM